MRTDEGNGVCREGGTENMERKSWWRIVLLSLLFCALSVAALAESYSTLRYLDNGSAVLSLQQALNQLGYSTGGADGKYGPATKEAVEQFQRNNNLKVDGIAGNATQTLLYQLTGGASATPAPDSGSSSSGSTTGGLFSGNYATLKYGSRGDRVSVLQKALNDLGFNAGSVDGNFGLGTQKAVTSFQKSAGLTQDGLAGRNTLTALERAVSGGTVVTPAPDTSTPTPSPTPNANGWVIPSRTLRKGYTGDDVKSVQSRLQELGYYTGSVDGNYGSGTMAAVKAFQGNNGLKQDGLAGSGTFAKLFSTSAVGSGNSGSTTTPAPDSNGWVIPNRTLRRGYTGDDVKSVQSRLQELGYYTGSLDGNYGSGTMAAVEAFQGRNGLKQDGIAGSGTFGKLFSTSAVAADSSSTDDPDTTDYPTLRAGDSGEEVTKMQQALVNLKYTLSVTGTYDAATKDAVIGFQQRNQLSVDGVAGPNTLQKLYSGNCVTGDTEISYPDTSIDGPNGSQVQLLHWFNDVKPTLKNGQCMEAYDPETGISWTLRVMSRGNHADVEPLTAADTAAMNQAFGNKESWGPKVVYVLLPDGRWSIASTHNVAHGGQTISDNNFDGQNCVHFLRDMDECMKNDPSYGVQNQEAIRKAWKELTGETVS